MAARKTVSDAQSVTEFVTQIENDQRRIDASALIAHLGQWTGEQPAMHGSSIVGFGSYDYIYDSGHSGNAMLAGFAPRKNELVIYLMGQIPEQATLLEKLGKHRMGKSCLYVKELDNIDLGVLEELVEKSVAALREKYPPS